MEAGAPVSLGNDEGGAGSAALLRLIRQGRSFSGREPHCIFVNAGDGFLLPMLSAASQS